MDGRMSMYVFLVCVWCSLDAGGLLMVVTAVPLVSAVILTPEADRTVGGQVDMRCTATILELDHIVEWMYIRENTNTSLRWDNKTINAGTRFMFDTLYPQISSTVQEFNISNLQIQDYDVYFCNARQPLIGGGSIIVATSIITLSPPSYPICSPSGPITVNTGTVLPLRCLSETDNPAVIMETHPMTDPRNYPWTSSSAHGTNTLALNLTVTVAGDVVVFNCSVLGSGADTTTRSCIIGPISVTMTTVSPTTLTSPTVPTANTKTPPSSNSAAIAGAVAGGVAAILIIVILILICRKRLHRHQNQKAPTHKPSTNTEYTPGHQEHAPSSFFDRSGMDIHDQSQANHHHYSEAETPVPKPASFPTDPSSPEPVVYAQPNKHQSTISTNSDAGGRYPENAHDVTPYTNPAFDSMDLDGSTEPTAPVKPVAKVRPSKKPGKPQPYQPKSERQSSPPDVTNQDPTPSSPPSQDDSHSSPHENTYAQVSRPKEQPSRPSNPDHIIYADLDMQSDEIQDGGPRPQPSSDAVMYASMKI